MTDRVRHSSHLLAMAIASPLEFWEMGGRPKLFIPGSKVSMWQVKEWHSYSCTMWFMTAGPAHPIYFLVPFTHLIPRERLQSMRTDVCHTNPKAAAYSWLESISPLMAKTRLCWCCFLVYPVCSWIIQTYNSVHKTYSIHEKTALFRPSPHNSSMKDSYFITSLQIVTQYAILPTLI